MKGEGAVETSHNAGPVKVMTVREVSAYLHVHRSTIYRLLKHRRDPRVSSGQRLALNIETIDSWRLAQGK